MGLPLGPTFANLFLCYYEKIWLQDCPTEFKPVFYRRYIDDTYVLFKKQDEGAKFLEYLNSKHKNIKFTHELEADRKINFLDVLISRDEYGFSTSVYRKNTFSGLGLSFFSFCSERFKTNSIKTLICRGYKICSNYINIDEEFNFLKRFFKDK